MLDLENTLSATFSAAKLSLVIPVSEHRNVLVTRAGMCLVGKWRLLPESYPPYPHLRWEFSQIAYLSMLRRRSVKLSNEFRYIVIHNLWTGGYFHWLTDALPRLWAAGAAGYADAVVLLPSNSRITEVMIDSIAALGLKYQLYPSSENVQVESLVLPHCVLKKADYHKPALKSIAEFYRDHFRDCDTGGPIRLYISREKASRRKVSNEVEVVKTLEENGFISVCLETLSFAQQVALMRRTEVLVSMHGAGLANIMFMSRGSAVIEFYKKSASRNVDFGRVRRSEKASPSYSLMAEALELKYQMLICEPNDCSVHVDRADLVIDINALTAALSSLGIATS